MASEEPQQSPIEFASSFARKISGWWQKSAGSSPYVSRANYRPLSLNIHNQALLTIFIKGMAQGILPLDQYRAFQAQDAVYFQKVATLYGNAAQEMLERENFVFADFYSIQSTKFLKLHKDFVDDKKPKKLDMDQVGNALQSYMRIQSQEEPEGLTMAMLLCSMLCPELAKSSAARFL